jgi:hypothetical protein
VIGPRLERDASTLTASYEALREHVLDSTICRHAVSGLVLFMREGMATWMENVAKEPMRNAATKAAPPIQIPDGIEQNLINIVANMAFVATLENVT